MTYKSTWENPLPEDEIGRQQAMKERLVPGIKAHLVFDGVDLGMFTYAGLWDTMHNFYPDNPSESRSLRQLLPDTRQRYAHRDLRGREFIRLPYTLLADVIHNLLQTDP